MGEVRWILPAFSAYILALCIVPAIIRLTVNYRKALKQKEPKA